MLNVYYYILIYFIKWKNNATAMQSHIDTTWFSKENNCPDLFLARSG
tara:strand:+ start:257896 stop:258036 length:141 start_codon:yes stop_codon:yes gene_type:complete